MFDPNGAKLYYVKREKNCLERYILERRSQHRNSFFWLFGHLGVEQVNP